MERCGFTVKDLPTGARILFRVVGINIAGRSEPATLLQPVTIREIVGECPHPALVVWSGSGPALSPVSMLQSNPRSASPATCARPTSAKWGSRSTW